MKFILFINMLISGTPLFSTTMTEFDDRAACEAAGAAVAQRMYKTDPRFTVNTDCLPKSSQAERGKK